MIRSPSTNDNLEPFFSFLNVQPFPEIKSEQKNSPIISPTACFFRKTLPLFPTPPGTDHHHIAGAVSCHHFETLTRVKSSAPTQQKKKKKMQEGKSHHFHPSFSGVTLCNCSYNCWQRSRAFPFQL